MGKLTAPETVNFAKSQGKDSIYDQKVYPFILAPKGSHVPIPMDCVTHGGHYFLCYDWKSVGSVV